MNGVNIEWNHGSLEASKSAAKDMVRAYNIAYAPALGTRHYTRLAIDMTITGVIGKSVSNSNGDIVKINTSKNLYNVGATYGVVKLVSDPPHWSIDGR